MDGIVGVLIEIGKAKWGLIEIGKAKWGLACVQIYSPEIAPITRKFLAGPKDQTQYTVRKWVSFLRLSCVGLF